MVFDTPFGFTIVGLVVFLIAYSVYSKIIDRKVWSPDRSRPTPAHVYADGVEFFPVGRFVLYGFQWNSIAALGPIIGPGTAALAFGWLPAFLWILFAALLIGWVQDYSAMFLSVRKEGRSFGPLAYEMLGPTPRKLLLGFLLFYLLLINAAFLFVVATVMNAFPGSFWSLLVLVIAAVITGHLLFKVKMNVAPVTILAVVLQAIGIALGSTVLANVPPPGTFVFTPPPEGVAAAANPYTYWLIPLVAILVLGSLLPMPRLITPMNYIAYYSLIPAVILLTVGALVSPATGVKLQVPDFRGWAEVFTVGPLWPALFVTIACGAISGWHSLISTGLTSKQIDVETDIRPVGAGAMITENLVGLTALAAWSSIPLLTAAGGASPGNFVLGATTLTSPLLGGEAAAPFLRIFFANYMVGMAVTILTILGRFWRVTMAEVFGGTPLSILGNKLIASILGFVLPIIFVLTGSWTNIWLYFGGTNQLLAGFALLIVGLFLYTQKRFHWYTTIPGIFMMVTTLAAIAYQTYVFADATVGAKLLHPTQNILKNAGGILAVQGINGFSTVVGAIMFIIGLAMAVYFVRGFRRAAKIEVKA
ncbi:MAG: carbon starvation CstA family protein [Candidatus Caldarchaeum sp.]|uniref:Carbon starvation protein A n=2 Tax=Caldiarchaeum subterraneum TaxID=311458 RepID=A0A7C4I1G2_CALS0|nr:carbon starvation protein A [Candidatus Caldarchaeales archaeon]MDJ0272102.1 carbon starvation protein A [Candidatus Caldarchaeales archaeon]